MQCLCVAIIVVLARFTTYCVRARTYTHIHARVNTTRTYRYARVRTYSILFPHKTSRKVFLVLSYMKLESHDARFQCLLTCILTPACSSVHCTDLLMHGSNSCSELSCRSGQHARQKAQNSTFCGASLCRSRRTIEAAQVATHGYTRRISFLILSMLFV